MHRRDLLLSALTAGAGLAAHRFAFAADDKPAVDTRLYELRHYKAAEGKLNDLHDLIRNDALKAMAKTAIAPVGFWTPKENPGGDMLILLSYPDKEGREKANATLRADEEFKKALEAKEANGKLTAKMDSFLLKTTDYSPAVKPDKTGNRVFEARHYTAAPGRLEALHSRFRDHTVALFKKHGMTNLGYWSPPAGEMGAEDTLIYLLAHKSVDAAKASFAAFGQDPEWQKAYRESEAKAGGPLTIQGGVKSFFLEPTDYSPWR
jgi:hypothetical protein